MPWKTKFNDEHQVAEIIFSGRVTHAEIIETISAGAALSHDQHRNRFLLRFEEVMHGPSPYELIDQIEHFETMGLSRNTKLAILLPRNQEIRSGLLFYETACLNRGYIVKTFGDHAEAIAWLCGGDRKR